MKMTILNGLGAFALVALSVSACNAPAPAAAAPPPVAVELAAPTIAKAEVSINAVMVALVDHAGHQLWNVEIKGKEPKTDADWSNIQEHAVQIAAAGPAITVGGSGPSDAVWVRAPSWHAYAQRMSDAGVAAIRAAESKNLTALVTANGELTATCEGCHKEFKPTVPTEGILHSHTDD